MDAINPQTHDALTIIAFIGSVFSPYYARARRKQAANAYNHVALNAVLYPAAGGKRWAMTERGKTALQHSPEHLQIGRSSLTWSGQRLRIELDEISVPWLRRIQGSIELTPRCQPETAFELAPGHIWHPAMPLADVEVNLNTPDWHWQGSGYADHNAGAEPLEDAFKRWTWSRSASTDEVTVFYETHAKDAEHTLLATSIDANGNFADQDIPPVQALPTTGWRIKRSTRARNAKVTRTLEDTPFYARSLVATEQGHSMHESLDMNRFAAPWVQTLLPFRMPRRAG